MVGLLVERVKTNEEFVFESADIQNSLDLFQWSARYPDGTGLVTTGDIDLFQDERIPWAANQLGGLCGKSILELGPYEAYNTYQMEILGANVLAIEANVFNYLKCLVVKNAFNLESTFLLGDFLPYLQQTPRTFDAVWLSGILYHMTDPVGLLQAASKVANTLFVWTHYYETQVIEGSYNEPYFDPSRDKTVEVTGNLVHLHHRNYQISTTRDYYSGGSEPFSYWLEKQAVFDLLRTFGFANFTIAKDEPTYAPGPAMWFIATRSG